MYRAAVRTASRPALRALARPAARAVPRRLASTASPADGPRNWKSSALRWGLAAAAVYYYCTSPVFADDAATGMSLPSARAPEETGAVG